MNLSKLPKENKLTRAEALARGHANPTATDVNVAVSADALHALLMSVPPHKDEALIKHLTNFNRLAIRAGRQVQNQVVLHRDREARKNSKANSSKQGKFKTLQGSYLAIIPDRIRTTLRWSVIVTGSGVAPRYFSMIPSDMGDPGGALSAAQPIGYDEWLAFYTSYIVMRSKLKVYLGLTAVAGQIPSVLSVALMTDSVAAGGFEDIPSQPRAWTAAYAPGGPAVELNVPWQSHASAFGVTEDEFRAQENFFGSGAAGPIDDLFWNFADSTNIGGTTSYNYYIMGEFDVEWFDRKSLDD